MRQRPRSSAALACLLSLCASGVASADTNPVLPSRTAADTSTPAESSARFAGRTAEEWRNWFQDTELTGSHATSAGPDLAALAVDQVAPAPLRRQATLTLGRIRPVSGAAVTLLEQLLDDTTPCETEDLPRSWALKSIALLNGPAARLTPQVTEILRAPETSPLDRLLCLEALARIGTAHGATLSPVVQALERGLPAGAILPDGIDHGVANLQFRRVAADVLTLYGPAAAPAVPALLRAARDEDEVLRRTAVTTLGTIKSPIALDPLVDILIIDPSPAVQDSAAVAISQLGPSAVKLLRTLLEDSDPAQQVRAADALRRIGPPARDAVDQLTATLSTSAPEVSIAAAEALWAVNSEIEPALETAVHWLAGPGRDVRMRAHRLILTIGRSTQDPAVHVRLQAAADSSDPRVRQAAVIALRELRRETGVSR